MVIACDTSFLFSLYGNDVHSPKAVAWIARNTKALHLNSLTHFVFGNAVRSSEAVLKLEPHLQSACGNAGEYAETSATNLKEL